MPLHRDTDHEVRSRPAAEIPAVSADPPPPAVLSSVEEADVVFVPHMHWDREWYEPFQVFRYRLVGEFDRLIETAEADPGFRFTLDGQTAAILDYLEMRPENEDRVRQLVLSGRLALGPWLILLDEFLCTGETIVRNLRLGIEQARLLGGAMALGYLPDMFGHIAQMPQILSRAGISHAALWRGVPASVSGHSFVWQAPDGSGVRTEYLFDGYDNGLDVLLVPEQIGRAIDDYTKMTAGRWGIDPVLGMAGTDHTAPDARLTDWLRQASQPDRRIALATIEEYVASLAPDVDAPIVRGELRSHARGNILPGILSVRRGLKQAMARAERTIDEAERLAAQWTASSPDEFLTVAWRKVIESSAHDSVVGSGTDETSEQVAARLAEADQIARAARDGVLDLLAESVSSVGYFVVNTLPIARQVMVDIEVEMPQAHGRLQALTADGRPLPIQARSTAETVLSDERFDASELERVLRRIHRRELFGRQIVSYGLEPGLLTFQLAEVAGPEPFDLMELRKAVAAGALARPESWRVLTITRPVRRAVVMVPVEASGRTAFSVSPTDGPAPPVRPSAPGLPQPWSTISNGILSVGVNEDGTLSLTQPDGSVLSGLGRLVDGGDRGDSYNYAPPADDLLVDGPGSVVAEVVEDGPVRSMIRVVCDYRLPAALSDDPDRRSPATNDLVVETLAELRAGEPFLRLTASFVNTVRDHRVRLHFPLPEPVSESASEGQFSVTRRRLDAEGGWGEFPIPTFPATSFIAAGPITVLLDHATEYEIVDAGKELAITLLRAVGSVSRNLHPLRDEPAAGEIAIPGAQALGETVSARLAILPSPEGWQQAQAVRLAEHFRSEALGRRGTAGSEVPLPAPSAGLEITGDSIAVSSVHRTGEGVEIRIVGMSDLPTTATITGEFAGASVVNLLGESIGEPMTAANGILVVPLTAWEILSLLLR